MKALKQCIDLGIVRGEAEAHLVKSGYWATEELRERNACQLSPSGFRVTTDQLQWLDRLAKATHTAVYGVNERLCGTANQRSVSNGDMRFLKLAQCGTRMLLSPKDQCVSIPPVIKVDLVPDQEGGLFIAEVDVYNPRGFGYLAYLDAGIPDKFSSPYEGIAGLAKLLLKKQQHKDAEWLIVVSEFERYYETTFRILAKVLGKYGVQARIERAGDLELDETLYSDHVFAIPDTMDKTPHVRETLMARYRAGDIVTFYPPVAYLGSKAFLPYLRHMPGMKEFIPPCALVCSYEKIGTDMDIINVPHVLKGVVSSGMRQVIFSDKEPGLFFEKLMTARSLPAPAWMLQQQVRQARYSINVFDDSGKRVSEMHFLRVTAYITAHGVLGLDITGRTDSMVHGAKDCIQIPAIA